MPEPVPAKHRQWGVRARPNSWTVTQCGRDEKVKREATITAGVLHPRYLKTYARPAPVNRATGATLRLDRSQRLTFFFSNALLKTVAVMSLLELVKKKSSKAPQKQNTKHKHKQNAPKAKPNKPIPGSKSDERDVKQKVKQPANPLLIMSTYTLRCSSPENIEARITTHAIDSQRNRQLPTSKSNNTAHSRHRFHPLYISQSPNGSQLRALTVAKGLTKKMTRMTSGKKKINQEEVLEHHGGLVAKR